ncbi:MAG: VOC family protein [Paracoccaceae bacterium]
MSIEDASARELRRIAPIVAVADTRVSVPFYLDRLGFRLEEEGRGYALVSRAGAAVMLLGGADAASRAATANHVAAYVWVADTDALWAELAPRLRDLPSGRVRAPFTQDYGMREFHVKDPDGFLLFFGMPVAPETPSEGSGA